MPMQTWGSSNGPSTPLNLGNMDYLNFNPSNFMPQDPAMMQSLSSMPSFSAGPSGGSSMFGGIGDWMNNSGFLGKTMSNGDKVQGWGMPVIGALGGLAQGYLGYQQLGQAKDALAENKKQFAMNWGAQQKTVNASLSDRQAARVASNPGAYQSVSDYMKTNGI